MWLFIIVMIPPELALQGIYHRKCFVCVFLCFCGGLLGKWRQRSALAQLVTEASMRKRDLDLEVCEILINGGSLAIGIGIAS